MKDFRKKISTKEELNAVMERRGKPEIHFHSACTLVWGGDPHAIKKNDREQKEIEMTQLAAILKPETVGKIHRSHITQIFTEKEHAYIELLRQNGMLQTGE